MQTADVAGNNTLDSGNTAIVSGTNGSGATRRNIHYQTLLMALMTIAAVQSFLLIVMARTQPRVQLMRNMLWAVIMGLFAYIVYFTYIIYGANVLPGASWVQTETYPWGTVVIVFIAMLLPLLWLQLRHE